MTTDIEQELRELFREKAGEAPLATPRAPATAPPQVLRRGRRRQVGTVLGSIAVVAVLVVGSVAGLQRLLADQEPLPTAAYDIFERTATVEAFTVTSPSDWYLVNQWPLSMQIAVESTSSSGFACEGVPVGSEAQPECVETVGEESSAPLPAPHGLPMMQLSNVDLGLNANACRDGIPNSGATLYVAFDAERAISGVADPTIPAFPTGPGLPPEGDGPCGPGRYARFTVNGEPFFAWIGLGAAVSDEDRETVETSFEQMTAIDDWTPAQPEFVTPGYVVAGGSTNAGEPWRLEVRRVATDTELSLVVARIVQLSLGSDEWCCASTTDGSQTSEPIFGTLRTSEIVEFLPADGSAPIAGTILPMPSSLGSSLDIFFIEGAGGIAGEVSAVGLGSSGSISPSPSPEPAVSIVSLSGGNAEHTWIVRFTGSFDDDSACIRVRFDADALDPTCPTLPEATQAGDVPSLHGWLTDTMYLLAGPVPSDVEDIRFVSDDGGSGITELQCTTGPAGWTDTKVCALTLPPAGSGTIRYLDAEGTVLSEEGFAWGAAEAALPPGVVDPIHGGTYWAVYPWVGAYDDPAADTMSHRLAALGLEAFPGDLACDQGAAEGLGVDTEAGIGVYFETRDQAEAFAAQLIESRVATEAPIAQVTTYCLD
jgi:hypothetical protein